MNLKWLQMLFVHGKHMLVKNAPHILMAMATGSSITAVIFAAKATPAAHEALWAKRMEKTAEKLGMDVEEVKEKADIRNEYEKLTPGETIKACGKFYIPSIGMELFSLLCFWTAHGIDIRRQAILAGLYSSAEQALIEYQKKVVEMIGKEPEKEIRTAVAQDHLNSNPPPTVIFDNDLDVWFYYKGMRFRSTYRKIKETQNKANAQMIRHLYISESELLWMFDPEHRYIVPDSDSGHVGWNVDRLMEFDILPIMTPEDQPAFEIEIRDEDGRPYKPQPGFSAAL